MTSLFCETGLLLKQGSESGFTLGSQKSGYLHIAYLPYITSRTVSFIIISE